MKHHGPERRFDPDRFKPRPASREEYVQKIVGFTGTRSGMTMHQKAQVLKLLQFEDPDIVVHGDCVGADADFDAICAELGIPRHIRPCTISEMRANTHKEGHLPAEEIAEPVAPMVRNRAIVADATVMIACPHNTTPIKRGSGTWATIGFAKKAQKWLYIVFPDGAVQEVGLLTENTVL